MHVALGTWTLSGHFVLQEADPDQLRPAGAGGPRASKGLAGVKRRERAALPRSPGPVPVDATDTALVNRPQGPHASSLLARSGALGEPTAKKLRVQGSSAPYAGLAIQPADASGANAVAVGPTGPALQLRGGYGGGGAAAQRARLVDPLIGSAQAAGAVAGQACSEEQGVAPAGGGTGAETGAGAGSSGLVVKTGLGGLKLKIRMGGKGKGVSPLCLPSVSPLSHQQHAGEE